MIAFPAASSSGRMRASTRETVLSFTPYQGRQDLIGGIGAQSDDRQQHLIRPAQVSVVPATDGVPVRFLAL